MTEVLDDIVTAIRGALIEERRPHCLRERVRMKYTRWMSSSITGMALGVLAPGAVILAVKVNLTLGMTIVAVALGWHLGYWLSLGDRVHRYLNIQEDTQRSLGQSILAANEEARQQEVLRAARAATTFGKAN